MDNFNTSKPYKNQWPEDQEKYPGRSDRYRRRMIKRDTEAQTAHCFYCDDTGWMSEWVGEEQGHVACSHCERGEEKRHES